jgi:hypothetical protein
MGPIMREAGLTPKMLAWITGSLGTGARGSARLGAARRGNLPLFALALFSR